MGERVQTGGLVSFDYKGSNQGKLSDTQRKDIRKGYDEFEQRKKNEKRRNLLILVLIIVVLAGTLAFLL